MKLIFPVSHTLLLQPTTHSFSLQPFRTLRVENESCGNSSSKPEINEINCICLVTSTSTDILSNL